MLARIVVPRVLAFRGIATTATQRDIMYHPLHESRIEYRQWIDHPNRNFDFNETAKMPFPAAPRMAENDSELNAIREKSKTQHWSTMSHDEIHKLYDGHFKLKHHHYYVRTDKWRFYLSMAIIAVASGLIAYRLIVLSLHGVHHAEYLNDPKFLEEFVKRGLQNNDGPIRGISSKWNYETKTWKESQPWYATGYYRYREGHSNLAVAPPKDGRVTFSGFHN